VPDGIVGGDALVPVDVEGSVVGARRGGAENAGPENIGLENRLRLKQIRPEITLYLAFP